MEYVAVVPAYFRKHFVPYEAIDPHDLTIKEQTDTSRVRTSSDPTIVCGADSITIANKTVGEVIFDADPSEFIAGCVLENYCFALEHRPNGVLILYDDGFLVGIYQIPCSQAAGDKK